jgi:hypothetical protein
MVCGARGSERIKQMINQRTPGAAMSEIIKLK